MFPSDMGHVATDDVEGILEMDADRVSHSPRNTKATAGTGPILETGKSVVSSSLLPATQAPMHRPRDGRRRTPSILNPSQETPVRRTESEYRMDNALDQWADV